MNKLTFKDFGILIGVNASLSIVTAVVYTVTSFVVGRALAKREMKKTEETKTQLRIVK